MSPESAQELGILIHRGLELLVRGWATTPIELAARLGGSSTAGSSELRMAAVTQAWKVFVSKAWRELTTGAKRLIPEWPLYATDGDNLRVGAADLVIESANRWVVVDYKLRSFGDAPHDACVAACRQLGYLDQVATYVAAVQQLTHQPVTGGVLTTSGSPRWITLVERQPAQQNEPSLGAVAEKTLASLDLARSTQ